MDTSPGSSARPPEKATSQLRPKVVVADFEPSTPDAFDADSSKHPSKNRTLIGAAWVTDGDTIKIGNTQVRLFGIDAPELDHPYGKKAKWALHKLCKGEKIRAEITDEDEHGRTVAKCFLPDGRDLSAEMVKLGMAIDWPKFSGGEYKMHEVSGIRRRLYLADARQKGRIHIWKKFEDKKNRPDQ